MKTHRIIAFGLCHQLLATLGVIIATSVSFYSIKPILRLVVPSEQLRRDTALVIPLFPLQAAVAFIAGFTLALKGTEFGRSMTARLVWVIPSVWLLIFFASWSPSLFGGENRWQHFFWSTSWSSIKPQLITTLPFITSVTYALGNYLGLKRMSKAGGPGKPGAPGSPFGWANLGSALSREDGVGSVHATRSKAIS